MEHQLTGENSPDKFATIRLATLDYLEFWLVGVGIKQNPPSRNMRPSFRLIFQSRTRLGAIASPLFLQALGLNCGFSPDANKDVMDFFMRFLNGPWVQNSRMSFNASPPILKGGMKECKGQGKLPYHRGLYGLYRGSHEDPLLHSLLMQPIRNLCIFLFRCPSHLTQQFPETCRSLGKHRGGQQSSGVTLEKNCGKAFQVIGYWQSLAGAVKQSCRLPFGEKRWECAHGYRQLQVPSCS